MLIKQEDGTEIEVIPVSEVEALKGPLEQEIARLNGVIGEKNLNFKKYTELSEEEKATMSESEKVAKQQLDLVQGELLKLQEELGKRDSAAVEGLKEKVINRLCGGDEAMKAKVLAEWDIINIQVTDERTALMRGTKAFGAAGGILDGNKNPIFADMGNGDSPTVVPGMQTENSKKNFLESDKGKAGAAMMGITEPTA